MLYKALTLAAVWALTTIPAYAEVIRYPDLDAVPQSIQVALRSTWAANRYFSSNREDWYSINGMKCQSNRMDYDFTACSISDVMVVLDRYTSTNGWTVFYLGVGDKRVMIRQGNTNGFNGAIILTGEDIPPTIRRNIDIIFDEYIRH